MQDFEIIETLEKDFKAFVRQIQWERNDIYDNWRYLKYLIPLISDNPVTVIIEELFGCRQSSISNI